MRIGIAIAAFFALMAFVQMLIPSGSTIPGSDPILALGFTMLGAFLFGKILGNFHLPLITGYLLAGILVGPYFLNMLSVPVVRSLRLVDDLALSLIALTAGGEFVIAKVRRQAHLIGLTVVFQILFVLFGTVVLVILCRNLLPFLSSADWYTVIGVGLIFGALSVAKSPATTVAIITETRAKGHFTDMVLSVTVVKDVVVVLLFAVVLALAEPLVIDDRHIEFDYLLLVSREIVLSLVTGIGAGYIIYLFLRFAGRNLFLFQTGFILFMVEISHYFHLEIILVFMMAGFVVQNFSRRGAQLIRTIEDNSLPVYVMFFAIAGASLNFELFTANWIFVLLLVLGRIVTTQAGTWLGARLAGAEAAIRNYAWMGFIGQAGVTLGLAVIADRALPGIIGGSIKTIIIGAIAINQILGPVLFRYALAEAGNIPNKVPEGQSQSA